MKLKEIGVVISRTFNLGNYESIRIEVSYDSSLSSDDSLESVRKELSELCCSAIKKTYKESMELRKGQFYS
ncbi:MAG: hypothetical protein GWN01_09400 [Nitrosopumilaceae archaeon]|nr:hypothetical protein [Nitrosopumilaceae archaeon]NIU87824.1 hypothetical protein [Nitrosopumilaceae archaeon]NIV65206.1 hypothetical protein [Nitrosopumilaceae archaeon]NIX61722.1 hypothetical protein [Nitrosopumilaceae archaeon]